MILFGSGKLIAVPTNSADGSAIANPTPVLLGTMQDVSLDISTDLKTLYGNKRFPVAVGQGKGKIELKAKYADISAGVLGSLFFGQSATAGIKGVAMDVAGTVPATPFQVTPTVPGSGTWLTDLGVYNATTGAQLTRVASSPATGQYAVSAGVYTFASADEDDDILFSFEYSASSSTGKIFTIDNQLMGYTPSFSVLLQNEFDGNTLVVKLNRAVSGKLALPMKNEDFTVSDFDAQAFADAAGNIGYISMF